MSGVCGNVGANHGSHLGCPKGQYREINMRQVLGGILLFAIGSVQAATVQLDGTRAMGIIELDVNGTLYDVTWEIDSYTDLESGGAFPFLGDFAGANASVDAINLALEVAGAEGIGSVSNGLAFTNYAVPFEAAGSNVNSKSGGLQSLSPIDWGTNVEYPFDKAVSQAYAVMTVSSVRVPTFGDVPISYWAFPFIEDLAASGITSGCGAGNYCPESSVTRDQMAVFLERGMNGGDYAPPAASGNFFLDVAVNSFGASYIEQLSLDGITSGCGSNNYCPDAEVSRAQMAVFLLKAKHGQSYFPPAATGVFNDVPLGHWAASWIEQLAAEGITSGCSEGMYCPEDSVTRAQMAVFLVRAFDL
jgi:hypothetical protein